MTEKLTGMSSLNNTVKKSQSSPEAERAAVRQLVQAARERGEDLTGPDGLPEDAHQNGPGDRAG